METLSHERRNWLPWLGVLLVLAVGFGWALQYVRAMGRASRPAFLVQEVRANPPERPGDGHLHVAGSGSCLPLARMLTDAALTERNIAADVHASIGSGGGIRALLDGTIDVALVSRPLRSDDVAAGLVSIPFARVPVVVAAGLHVPARDLSFSELEAVFGGRTRTWSDGSNVVVLLREDGDSSHQVVDVALPGFEALVAEARSSGRYRVLYHDAAMQAALANTAGAVGLHGNGVDASLAGFRALSVEGVAPTGANVESGRYPFVKELAFVTVGPPSGDVKVFIDFALSSQGRALLRMRGAVPPPNGGAREP